MSPAFHMMTALLLSVELTVSWQVKGFFLMGAFFLFWANVPMANREHNISVSAISFLIGVREYIS